MITEDRKQKGLVLEMSVHENLTLPKLEQLAAGGFIQSSKERDVVLTYIHLLNIKASSPHLPVKALSGGNQQKVVFGKWLAMNRASSFWMNRLAAWMSGQRKRFMK
ncbi:Ribose import ATP-binding protein RbsA [Geobacillus sp. BCO2]|nr:Ribose import ATP-binding protein RbsA [Geobacillus sp. BCO2]